MCEYFSILSVDFPWNISADLERLLRGLLEKDPLKRYGFQQIKENLWVTCDLPEKQQWISETDPKRLELVEVTDTEIDNAFKLRHYVFRQLKKLSINMGAPRVKKSHSQEG